MEEGRLIPIQINETTTISDSRAIRLYQTFELLKKLPDGFNRTWVLEASGIDTNAWYQSACHSDIKKVRELVNDYCEKQGVVRFTTKEKNVILEKIRQQLKQIDKPTPPKPEFTAKETVNMASEFYGRGIQPDLPTTHPKQPQFQAVRAANNPNTVVISDKMGQVGPFVFDLTEV